LIHSFIIPDISIAPLPNPLLLRGAPDYSIGTVSELTQVLQATMSEGLAQEPHVANVFIHSFIQTISIAPLQDHFYSEALLTQHEYCAGVSRRSATCNCEL